MARYASRPTAAPCSWLEDDVFAEPSRLDIAVSDHAPVNTGQQDARGQAIFRLPNPIGFGRDEEW